MDVSRPALRIFASLALLLWPTVAVSADALRVGSANTTSPGSLSVPIYLFDEPGTLLGPGGQPIHGIALAVSFSPTPPGLAGSVRKAGFFESASAFHERSSPRPDGVGYFLWPTYSPSFPPAAGYGVPIAFLDLSIPSGLPSGSRIALSLVRGLCMLSNGYANVFVPGSGLTLHDGVVHIGPYYGDATRDGVLDVFDLVTLANFITGNVSPGQAPFLGTREAMNLDPAGGATVDVFDLVLLAGHLVGNVPTLPVP
jgi:hypothetical protein